MPTDRRKPSAAYRQRFLATFEAWRWPDRTTPRGSPLAIGEALRAWAGARPEDAEDVQRLAVATAAMCSTAREFAGARRIVEAGLDASLIGAPSGAMRRASATTLALLGARLAFDQGDLAGARILADRARTTADPGSGGGVLASYLRLHLRLLEARLAEAALEVAAARDQYRAAADLAATLGDGSQAVELLPAWSELMYGPVGAARAEAVESLLHAELEAMTTLALLGLARTSSNAEPARDAIDRCIAVGLPVAESGLAFAGVLERLPASEIDGAADRLVLAADKLEPQTAAAWRLSVQALRLDAWLTLGGRDQAAVSLDLERRAATSRADIVATMIAFAGRARERYEAGDDAAGWSAIQQLLSVRTETAGSVARSHLNLRARAACEPALVAGLRAETAGGGGGGDASRRRRLAVLVDSIRSAEDAPPIGVGGPDSRRALDRAEWLAADRVGRLAYQASRGAHAGDVLVLVVQGTTSGIFFLAIGADESAPVVATEPSPGAQRGLANLTVAAEQAVAGSIGQDRLLAQSRAAFDALPEAVRDRLRRASIVLVVPDLTAGRDRTPFELLHDGETYLGLRAVMSRCLSLSQALRALEPSLLPRASGRRALCVAVAAPPGMPALDHAASEPDQVRRAMGHGWDAHSLLESEAEPAAILELAPVCDVLHIACHGDSAAGAEALVLADGRRLRAIDIATRHRLGGFAYINACSLGRGRYVGGGLSRGAAYAFARAGSPAVVANLLPVADASAAELAAAFYAEARDHPVGEALRRARLRIADSVSAAFWSTTVLIGDPLRHLDGSRDTPPDESGRLLDGEPTLSPDGLAAGRKAVLRDPDDVRLAAVVELSKALKTRSVRLDVAARVARELGHDVGEAHCLLELAETTRRAGDARRHELALRDAIRALEPLRDKWHPAYDAHRDAQAELRSLDPTFTPREVQTFQFESGLSVNDRSVPAVDAVLQMSEAMFEHERFWRGEPALAVPDGDTTSIAHNALVWGWTQRLYATGAESAYALACAQRLAWRGLLADEAVADLHRVWAGLLYFLWGQQKVTHLESWMLRAHTRVLEIGFERVGRAPAADSGSTATRFMPAITSALDALGAGRPAGSPLPSPQVEPQSRFARARAALSTEAPLAPVDETSAAIATAIGKCHRTDRQAAADLGAWVVGEVLERERAATDANESRQSSALAMRSLLDRLAYQEEGWIMPYLEDGFAEVRETGGLDTLARWSRQVL